MVEPTIDILDKYLKGQASDDEIRQVEEWIRYTGINEESLRKIISLPDGVKLMLSINTQNDWLKVKHQLTMQKNTFWHLPILRMASAILLLLAVGYVIYFVSSSNLKKKATYETIANDGLDFKKVILLDGSVAFLNGRSKITYSENFSDKRHLTMEGEVFFEVKHNDDNPFVITAKQTSVTVLGTTFNVYADSGKVEVSVTSGKVSFQGGNAGSLLLNKGESGIYSSAEQSIIKEKIRDLNYLSWKTGILEFEKMPLDMVGRALEKHFSIEVIINDTTDSLPTYTSSFDHPTLEEILNEMEAILQIKWRLSENQKQVFIQLNN